mmetsp:Transcript_19223/g.28440  ORF Transcript_19223/g.28440 Transcript_19223/m.28440 type:complete len:429 (+) Transcript_19223:203-1489(+)
MSNIPVFPDDENTPSKDQHTSFDILLGKQKAVFNHSGNKKFRAIVNYNVPKYMDAFTKSCKTQLVRKIYEDMKQSGFRFLKKRKGDDSPHSWEEIEESDAREKVSHALRDRVREVRKPTRYCKRSQDEVSPMILAMSKILFQNSTKVPCAMRSEGTQFPFTERLTQNLLYPEMSSMPLSKPSTEAIQNAQRRPSLLSILSPFPIETELGPGETRRTSLLGVDYAQSRKLNRSLDFVSVSRRSSMDSLFGGMAHEIADANPSSFCSRRASMLGSATESNTKHDADVPVKCITIYSDDNEWKHDDITPINYLTGSALRESSGQGRDDKSITNSNRRISMNSLNESLDHKDTMLCSVKSGRRLSMLSLSLEDLAHSFYDRDCELSAMAERRMSIVSSSLDLFRGADNCEKDYNRSCRRQSMMSSFSELEFN